MSESKDNNHYTKEKKKKKEKLNRVANSFDTTSKLHQFNLRNSKILKYAKEKITKDENKNIKRKKTMNSK